MNRIKGAISYTLVAAACALIVIISVVLSGLTLTQGTRVLAGIMLLCFLPGYAWSFALFPSKTPPLLERLSFAILLSVGLVPTGLITAHALRLRVTTFSTLFVALTIIAIGFAIGMYRRKHTHLKGADEEPTYISTL